MDLTNSRIAQVYGYAVCFITVIMMLVAIKGTVDAAFDLSDPIRAESGGYGRSGRPLTNFELYKLEARRQPEMRSGPMPVGAARPVADTLSDVELRKLYDAEREQAIGNAKFRAIRNLVGNLLLITLSAALFAIHWRWLKRRDTLPATG